MFIDVNEFKRILGETVEEAVRNALAGQAVQANTVADVVDAVVEEKEEEPKPKKDRKPRKTKAQKEAEELAKEEAEAEQEDAPFSEEDETEEEKAESTTEKPEDAKAFVNSIKEASGGNVVKAKKLLKSLIGVTSFAECPEDRWVEYLEALSNA